MPPSQTTQQFSITIPSDAWEDTEGDGSRLLTTLVINGTDLHLEAIRVRKTSDGGQVATNERFEPSLSALYQHGGDGPFDTTRMRGGTYVLAATPYQ